MALLRKIYSFNHQSDDICICECEYIERVDQYFFAKDIDDAKKKTAIFLTVIGSNTYSFLINLLPLASPSTRTVQELFEILKKHLKPQPIVIAERYKFLYQNCRDQNENETVGNHISVLQKLNLNCNFTEVF